MTGNILADLAVLGISQQHPITVIRVSLVAKTLVPDLWQPTVTVIEEAIYRNLDAGYLKVIVSPVDNTESVALTISGADRISSLLLHDTGSLASAATLALEAVQFCFLDLANHDTTTRVLTNLRVKLRQRLAQFESRCQRCPHGGRFTRLWMTNEQNRMENMARLLAEVSNEAGANRHSSYYLQEAAE